MWQHLLVTIRAEIDCIMMRDALRIHVYAYTYVHVHVHVHCDAGPNTTARATIANTPFTIKIKLLHTRATIANTPFTIKLL